MITVTKHIKINVLTIFLFAFGFVFHYPVIFYITYAVMVLHEAAHLAAAVKIGLRVDYIAFMPFGMCLRLKNKMIPSVAEEIILYISGPLVNAFTAFFSIMFFKWTGDDIFRLFYISNLSLFVINLLPAPPLDGGMILKRVLMRLLGYKSAVRVCRVTSAAVCVLIGFICICSVYVFKNFSSFLFFSLLVGNFFTQREKYDAEYILARIIEHKECKL